MWKVRVKYQIKNHGDKCLGYSLIGIGMLWLLIVAFCGGDSNLPFITILPAVFFIVKDKVDSGEINDYSRWIYRRRK